MRDSKYLRGQYLRLCREADNLREILDNRSIGSMVKDYIKPHLAEVWIKRNKMWLKYLNKLEEERWKNEEE